MHRVYHRFVAGSAATLAALALGAAPAVAGEDDGDDDAQIQAPAAPAPVPVEPGDSGSGALSAVPQGGVATGAGGTAPRGTDAVLLGLASGALVLIATGGGVMAASRRTGP